jgi:hypothetical protein
MHFAISPFRLGMACRNECVELASTYSHLQTLYRLLRFSDIPSSAKVNLLSSGSVDEVI